MNLTDAKKRNMFLFVFALAGIVLFKAYKYYVRSVGYYIDCDEYCAYLFDQKMFTVYRVIFGLTGLFVAYKFQLLITRLKNLSFTLVSYFILLPYLFFSARYLSDVTFVPLEFFNELFFNFFTGVYEEVFFRILLFGVLSRYLSLGKSAILSSLAFALWHLDVSSGPMYLFFVFSFGMYVSLAMAKKVSALELILFHFAWDQIMFGLTWAGILPEDSEMFHLNLSVALFVAAGIFFKLNKNNNSKIEN